MQFMNVQTDINNDNIRFDYQNNYTALQISLMDYNIMVLHNDKE